MARHLQPFVCERCGDLIRDPDLRRVVSIDSTDAGTTVRYARRMLGRFCMGCAGDVVSDIESRYGYKGVR